MALIKCPECNKEMSSGVASCPSCGYPIKQTITEPEFRAYRKRKLICTMIGCIIGLPMGVALNNALVWALAILGIIISGIKLARTK